MPFDAQFVGSFNPQPTDYVGIFTRGFNINEALPWSESSRRKRALEDFQIEMRTRQFAAQQAQQAQEMKMKESLFPYQLLAAKRRALGFTDSSNVPATSGGGLQGYIQALRQATQQPVAETVTEEVVEEPLPQPASPIPPFGVSPDAPVF